jgi:fatty-acyl-CoA synthase
MTETASQAATMSPTVDPDRFPVAVPPLPFCEIEIRDEDGQSVAPGVDGTICIRGPMVSDGYWKSPDEIEPIGIDGWLETNDIGALDADGCLTVHGRRDNVIITGGKKVCPEEIERALEQLPNIHRAAVIGVDDPEWGQAVVALIEIETGANVEPETLKQQLVERLEGYKIPRQIHITDRIPTTAAGKIDRQALTDVLAGISGG